MKNDKLQQIASDNLKLLEKMTAIHQRRKVQRKPRSAALMKGQALCGKTSLNEAARRNEQTQIARENKKIRERINR